jgi:hypothetical protein
MAEKKSTATNPLYEPGDTHETLANCRNVLQYVRLHQVEDDDDEARDGSSIVLNCVCAALEALDAELAPRKALEVVRG